MNSVTQIDKLGDANYQTWKVQIKSLLIQNDLWSYVDGTEKKPVEAEKSVIWTKCDQKALASIILSLQGSQIINVKNCGSSREAWLKLQEIHQPRGPATKVTLFRKLIQLKMNEGQNPSDHLQKFHEVVEILAEVDLALEEELLSVILLSSLPKSFENFVVAVESREMLPGICELKSKLLEESQRRDGELDTVLEHEQAYYSKPRGNGKREQKKTFTGKCYICKKKGHYASSCISREYNKGAKKNCSFSLKEGEVRLERNTWIIDSGSTSHMCHDKSLFSTFEYKKEKIELAANHYIEARGFGNVKLQTRFGSVTLQNVLFVPELNTNFISVSKATTNGLTVEFTKNYVHIKNTKLETILSAEKTHNLFVYIDRDRKNKLLLCDVGKSNDLITWHERFGHLNVQSLIRLQNENMVRGLKLHNKDPGIMCETCAKGKINVKPFQKTTTRNAEDILELVHTDICGPMRTQSIGGAKYFLLFIDDYSRKLFVYFLKHKSEAFAAFKVFKKAVEKKTGKFIKALRSDNGREYVNKEFSSFLASNGIERQLSADYTPQQNGVAERANRTVLEMARCNLIGSGLPESFWAEALASAVYIRNRSPSKVLGNKTPEELWTKKKPSVSHLRTFGCKAVMLDKRPGRSKLFARGVECVMVGYCSDARAYRLYDRNAHKLFKSRDVIFMEQTGNSYNVNASNDYCSVEEMANTADNKVNEVKEEKCTSPAEIPRDTESETEVESDIENDTNLQAQRIHKENGTGEETQGGDDPKQEAVQDAVCPPGRKKGRPKVLRTGKPGRPRKLFHSLNIHIEDITPTTVEEALSSSDADEWVKAMRTEIDSLVKNDTWNLVEVPEGKRPISCKWVFTKKRNKHGKIERYKARLVAKGCSQRWGVDYQETFSPVVRHSTIRLLLALSVECELLVHQIDVTSAYLNSDIQDDVFMKQPDFFKDKQYPDRVCKLKKALYGLKQSGREWNRELHKVLRDIGFTQSTADPCAYIMNKTGEINLILVYVDDLILASSKHETLEWIKCQIGLKFDYVDKGPIDYYLGVAID